jgi:hypothetical protein
MTIAWATGHGHNLSGVFLYALRGAESGNSAQTMADPTCREPFIVYHRSHRVSKW